MDTMKENYHPETNISDELGDDLATQYQQMIGILRWPIELEHIDIITELSFLSSFKVSPREGHLEATHQIFGYSVETK